MSYLTTFLDNLFRILYYNIKLNKPLRYYNLKSGGNPMNKVKAINTLRNSYFQVLFMAGRIYSVVDEDEKRLYVLNELHTETVIRKNKLARDFVEVEK